MTERSILRQAAPILALLALSACSLAPTYERPQAPVPALATADKGQSLSLAVSQEATPDWRSFFPDESLRGLIQTGLEHNRDIRIAALNVAQASASLRLASADRLPSADLDAPFSYSGTFKGSRTERYEPQIGLAFDLDLFGRLKSLSEAALANRMATIEAEKAVKLALISSIATAWLDETLAYERLWLAEENEQSWNASLAFIERRLQSGSSSLLEMEQTSSAADSAKAALSGRQRELTLARNALKLLIGEQNDTPESPRKTQLSDIAFAPLPSFAPSSTLLGRPDVMEAEYALKSANADIGAARAAFFPSISLTGALGSTSGALSGLFSNAAGIWSFIPKASLPIFNGGRNQANLDLAELRKNAAIASYEKTIQTAFREVSDALQTRDSFIRQIEAQKRYVASLRRVLDLATNRYANGVVSYLEVLDARRAIYQAEQDLSALNRDRLVNEINLFTALGGGWSGSSDAKEVR